MSGLNKYVKQETNTYFDIYKLRLIQIIKKIQFCSYYFEEQNINPF